MTPLAQSLQRELLKPARKRAPFWQSTENAQRLQRCTRVKCFDFTAALPLLDLLPDRTEPLGPAVFLPATWVEICRRGRRIALILEAWAGGSVLVNVATVVGPMPCGVLFEKTVEGGANPDCNLGKAGALKTLSLAACALAIINSPRVVAAHTHAPHRGLVREMRTHKLSPPGEWYEIKLHVTKPRYVDDGAPHADQITGQRALHFVRKFIRIRLGKLEYVREHWRGDPALGVRQSDYRVSI